MSLSIVIPSHKRADLLRLCLASVVRFAPPGTEMIVVDDASRAGVVSETARAFPDVAIVRLEQRGGFCAAANAGVRAARHPIVELLNDDTEVTEGWTEAARAAFARPEVAAVAPLVLQRMRNAECGMRNDNKQHSAIPHSPVPRVDSAGDRYFLGGVAGKRGHNALLAAEWLCPGYVFGASASSAFYRREVYLRLGGLPEEFGAYFDDVDLSFRLHRAGYRVWYEPASRVYHRVGSSHGRSCPRLLEQQSRNEERVFWRNLPGRALLKALPWHAAVLLAKAWRRWRCGELLPFLRGRLSLLGELPELLRHRRQLRRLGTACLDASWNLEDRLWRES